MKQINAIIANASSPSRQTESDLNLDVKDRVAKYVSRTVILIIALGIALRVRDLAAARSLWLDEAALALNLIVRPFRALLLPLDYGQAAPVGFLVLQKLMVVLFGPTEMTFRVLPFTASVGSLFLIDRILKRTSNSAGRLVALFLFAICDPVINFSAQNKQYGVDVAVTCICLLALFRSMERRDQIRRFMILGVLGCLSIYVSHVVIFILFACGCVLLIEFFYSNATSIDRRILVAIGAAWIISFIANDLLFLQALKSNAGLHAFWDANHAFLPLPLSFPALKAWSDAFFGMFVYPGGILFSGLAASIFLVGVVAPCERRMTTMRRLIVAVPIACAMVASATGKFPFATRIILFITPLLFISIGAGVDHLWKIEESSGVRIIAGIVVPLLMLYPTWIALNRALHSQGIEELGALTRAADWHPDDAVFVHEDAKVNAAYYLNYDPRRTKVPLFIGGDCIPMSQSLAHLSDFAGRRRVWIITAGEAARVNVAERAVFWHEVDSMARLVHRQTAEGADLALYDFTMTDPSAPRPGR